MNNELWQLSLHFVLVMERRCRYGQVRDCAGNRLADLWQLLTAIEEGRWPCQS